MKGILRQVGFIEGKKKKKLALWPPGKANSFKQEISNQMPWRIMISLW